MTVQLHHLRRYVIDRASGQTPRHEFAFFAPGVGAWIRADEITARRHEYWRRIRIKGRDWCDVLGHQTSVRDDVALQTFFMTFALDDWPSLAAAVREHPARCLRDWRTAGSRIIAAVAPGTVSPHAIHRAENLADHEIRIRSVTRAHLRDRVGEQSAAEEDVGILGRPEVSPFGRPSRQRFLEIPSTRLVRIRKVHHGSRLRRNGCHHSGDVGTA